MTHLSDEFLLAYLDGQLERGQASNVTQLVAANAEVSRRLMRLKRTQAQLLETFGAFAREEAGVPTNLAALSEPDPKSRNKARDGSRAQPEVQGAHRGSARQFLFVTAVFAGGLLGGYGATLLAAEKAPPPAKTADRPPAAVISPVTWASDIAKFHAFFPKETLTPHPDAISNPELIRFQLTKVAAKALTPPDFQRQGYTLFRGQVFHYNQDRMMQLTYASKSEPPLTLYVLPGTGVHDMPITPQGLGTNKALSWVSDHVRFLLTGERNEEDLKVLAVIAQSQMPKKG